jgi:DNA-binding transcriptional ArsR family regulator
VRRLSNVPHELNTELRQRLRCQFNDIATDHTRVKLHPCERILARPSRILFLAEQVPVTRPAVSHHVRVLKQAGLVREDQGLLIATTDVLPAIRVYFDRLWFEASVGEGWMRERFAVSRRMHWRGAEIGLPASDAKSA